MKNTLYPWKLKASLYSQNNYTSGCIINYLHCQDNILITLSGGPILDMRKKYLFSCLIINKNALLLSYKECSLFMVVKYYQDN